MPAGSNILPLRSNIPAIAEYVFSTVDSTFTQRAQKAKSRGGGIIIGHDNYGQGSSREHAALAPMYLGIQAVIARSFARIHRSNLINFGIVPLRFENDEDFKKIESGDMIQIRDMKKSLNEDQTYQAVNITKNYSFAVSSNLNEREKEIILSGGLLPNTKKRISHSQSL